MGNDISERGESACCPRCGARWEASTNGSGHAVLTCGECGAREIVRPRRPSLADRPVTRAARTPCVVFSVRALLAMAERIRRGRSTLNEESRRMGFSEGTRPLRIALTKVLGTEAYAAMISESRSKLARRRMRRRG